MGEGYVPTLRQYAAVIDWLWEERHDPERNKRSGLSTFDMPKEVRDAFDDALHRMSMYRVAQRMGAIENEAL